tara:strand:+ start:1027 stop:1617 length:591 start_codon:yes stop_codon:yes gene_type:complete
MGKAGLLDLPDDILLHIYYHGAERLRNTALQNPGWLCKGGTRTRCQFTRRFSSISRRFLYLKRWPIVISYTSDHERGQTARYKRNFYRALDQAIPCWKFEISRRINPKAYKGSNYSSAVLQVVKNTARDIIDHRIAGKVGCLHVCVNVPQASSDWLHCRKEKLYEMVKNAANGSGISFLWIYLISSRIDRRVFLKI